MSEMKMNEENVNETKLSQLLGEENLEMRMICVTNGL